MSDNDELLFGEARGIATDSDGDGISDDQERLDGTDPNDAADSIRQRETIGLPSDDPRDPRGDLNELSIERETVVDVAGAVPSGHTLDQALPTGLDGETIGGSPNRYLNDDAEEFMSGRDGGANSPIDMQRDPTIETIVPTADTGRDATIDTLGREAGPGAGGAATFDSGGVRSDPPPGEGQSGSADPGNNPDLVSQNSTPGELAGLVKNPFGGGTTPKKESPQEKWMRESGKSTDGGTPTTLPEYKPPKYEDPDAAGGTVVVTQDDIEAAIVRNDGVTDFVEGYGGGTQIEGDAPPIRPRDLVTDPGDEDPGAVGESSGTISPPGGEISKPVNPMDGIGPVRDPSSGTAPGGGGEPDQLQGVSSAATAAESSAMGGGISAVGADAGGDAGDGIQSVASQAALAPDITGTVTSATSGGMTGDRPFTDSSGVEVPSVRPSGGNDGTPDITGTGTGEPIDLVITGPRTVASTGGDDDDLEELEVQRATNPDAEDGSVELVDVELLDGRLRDVAVDRPAVEPSGEPDVVGGNQVASEGPGTQTEDEIYVGMVDPDGGGTDGSGTPFDGATEFASVGAPVIAVQFAEPIAMPLDPVTELLAVPPDQFSVMEGSFAARAVEPEPAISEVLDDDDL